MKVVCDSTVLIGLAKISKIEILREIYKEIIIPEAVFTEVVGRGEGRPGVQEVRDAKWIHKSKVKDKRTVEMLIAELGHGEAEVLVLGKELNADWLIIDDERARNFAISAGFKIIGIAGILLLAKKIKLIPLIKPLLMELKNKNFRLSNKILTEVLKKAEEN